MWDAKIVRITAKERVEKMEIKIFLVGMNREGGHALARPERKTGSDHRFSRIGDPSVASL